MCRAHQRECVSVKRRREEKGLTRVCIYIYVERERDAYMCVYMYTYMYIHVYYIYIYIYVYLYIYIFSCVYICPAHAKWHTQTHAPRGQRGRVDAEWYQASTPPVFMNQGWAFQLSQLCWAQALIVFLLAAFAFHVPFATSTIQLQRMHTVNNTYACVCRLPIVGPSCLERWGAGVEYHFQEI